MAGTYKIPVNVGNTAETQKRVGTLRLQLTPKQASIMHLAVLMPNYDVDADGNRRVTSYTLVQRTDVLSPKLLDSITKMEMRSEKYHDDRRSRSDGDTEPTANAGE